MISKEQYINNCMAMEAAIKKYFNDEYNKWYDQMLHGETEQERKYGYNGLQYIDSYRREYKAKTAYNYGDEYDSCECIWRGLAFDFKKTEWVGDDIFAVTTGYSRLSGFAIMLKCVYGVEATSGFSFSSSFTEHQGETKLKHPIRITADDENRCIIKFQLKPIAPYWLPKEYWPAK